tara:strand:+ start:185 stop:841 length:657 start_codon:yes stop_codon:yes gene_type:complete
MENIILIPAYNPPASFIELIKKIQSICILKILIIDDGSDPVINIINNENIILMRNKTNRGKGYSLLKGFKYCKENNHNYCITIDADSQHDPFFINKFINTDKNFSLVLGKRKFTKDMPIHRRASNLITSKIISFLSKSKINDSQCGFRRYNVRNVLDYNYKESGYQFETEVLIKLLKKNNSFKEINIPTIYNEEKSFINNIDDTYKFIRLILRVLLKK